MSDVIQRVRELEARVTQAEGATMDQAYKLGGLDAEMDGINHARYCWFDNMSPQTLGGRVSAVERLADAIGQRIQASKQVASG